MTFPLKRVGEVYSSLSEQIPSLKHQPQIPNLTPPACETRRKYNEGINGNENVVKVLKTNHKKRVVSGHSTQQINPGGLKNKERKKTWSGENDRRLTR